MKRRILSIIAIVLILLSISCDSSVKRLEEGNINYNIYPYLEFDLSYDSTYYIAYVVEGAKVTTISIPGEKHTDYGAMPVKVFGGFRNPEDAKYLETIVLDKGISEIKAGALDKASSIKRIESISEYGTSIWANLPILNREGFHFLGWRTGDRKFVVNGMPVDPQYSIAEPVFEEHKYIIHEGKDATCTENGWKEYGVCSVCGHSTYEDVPALGHDLVHIERSEATCKKEGILEHYHCSRCNKNFTDIECTRPIENVTIPKISHNLRLVASKEATCSDEGNIEHYRCSYCDGYFLNEDGTNEVTKESVILSTVSHVPDDYGWYSNYKNHYHQCKWCNEAIDVSPHVSDGGTIKVHPTLHDKGIMKYSCTVCGYTWEKDIPEDDHVPVFKETVAPTCTERGYDLYVCGNEDCGAEVKINYKDSLGHNASYVPKVYATCTEDGKEAHYECSRCNKLFWNKESTEEVSSSSLIIFKTGHNFDTNTWVKDGTYHWHPCINIDQNTGIKCDAKGNKTLHSYTREIVSTSTLWQTANCTEKARYWKSCECGDVSKSEWFEYGEPLGHSLIHNEEKPSTCIAQGNKEYWSCSVCKKNYSDSAGKNEITGSVLLPLSGHTWDEGYQADNTYHWQLCTVCGMAGTKVIHTSEYGADFTHHWYQCSICSYRLSENVPHNFVILGDVEYCTDCGVTKERTDSEPGFDVDPVYSEPTGEIDEAFDAKSGKWTFILRSTNSDSAPTNWTWYIDDTLQSGANGNVFEFTPPHSESYVVMCIFWNTSGYGSASVTINKNT